MESKELLDTFWRLSEPVPSKRAEAALTLCRVLERQAVNPGGGKRDHGKETPILKLPPSVSHEMQYTVDRLVSRAPVL